MTDEESFLQAILASPHDDVPRLQYADWLEEQGDPRGEFIRLQVERSRLDPLNARQETLRVREYELLSEHGNQWLKQLRAFRLDPDSVTFRRGFPDSMTVTPRKFIDHAAQIVAAEPTIRGVTIGGLSLIANNMTRIACLRDIVNCPALSHFSKLNLTCNAIDNGGVMTLARSPYLGNITHLDLSSNHIGRNGAAALAGCAGLPRLSCLDLSINHIGDHGVAALSTSRNLGALRQLDLSANEITDQGALLIAGSKTLGQLTELNLMQNDIGPRGARARAGSESTPIPNLRNLMVLGLDMNPDLQQQINRQLGARRQIADRVPPPRDVRPVNVGRPDGTSRAKD